MSILARLIRRLNLRYPTLFALFALLTLLDLVVPDPLPLVDELGLALLTLLLALWRDRRPPPAPGRRGHMRWSRRSVPGTSEPGS